MADAIYYHTKASGTGTSIKFFNTNEGASGEVVTNLPTTNQLNRNFTLHKLKIRFSQDLVQADALKLSEGAIVKLIVNKDEVIKMPLIDCVSNTRIEAAMTENAGDLWQLFKPAQDGYEFKEPVTIPANTFFEVEIVLESGLGTDTDVTCTLEGTER